MLCFHQPADLCCQMHRHPSSRTYLTSSCLSPGSFALLIHRPWFHMIEKEVLKFLIITQRSTSFYVNRAIFQKEYFVHASKGIFKACDHFCMAKHPRRETLLKLHPKRNIFTNWKDVRCPQSHCLTR